MDCNEQPRSKESILGCSDAGPSGERDQIPGGHLSAVVRKLTQYGGLGPGPQLRPDLARLRSLPSVFDSDVLLFLLQLFYTMLELWLRLHLGLGIVLDWGLSLAVLAEGDRRLVLAHELCVRAERYNLVLLVIEVDAGVRECAA